MCAVQNKLTIFAWVSQYCSIRIWSVLFRCNDFWFCFEIQSITSKDPFLNCMTLQSTWSAPKISNIWNWDPPGVVDARALGENKDRQSFRILHMLPQPVSQQVIIEQNNARIAKEPAWHVLYKLPGMSSLKVSFVFPVCPAHNHHGHFDHHDHHDRHDHGDNDDHGDCDDHGDHKQFGGYNMKLEVVHKEIGDCT